MFAYVYNHVCVIWSYVCACMPWSVGVEVYVYFHLRMGLYICLCMFVYVYFRFPACIKCNNVKRNCV